MQTEFETKVLEIDKNEIIKLIEANNFTQHAPQDFRRYVYEVNAKSWIRLRTDGRITTLTYKLYEKNSIDGVQELEIVVSDFEKTHEMLLLMGLKTTSYQENRRYRFTNEEVELALDEWPLIPAYLEIEGSDVKVVNKYVELFKLTGYERTSEPTSAVYKRYGLDINDHKELSF
jgi:adenylate cyclase class 2